MNNLLEESDPNTFYEIVVKPNYLLRSNVPRHHTPLIPSEISRENARAWVSMDFK